MAEKSAQARSRLIGQVIQAVHKRLSAAKAKRAEAFVRQFFANVPPSDLRGETVENLAGGALALWENLQQRAPGKASVRAYNPDGARDGWESPHSVIEIINDDMPFLVDSVTAEINRNEAEVHLVIHPIVSLRRDPKGKLLELAEVKPAPKQGAAGRPRAAAGRGAAARGGGGRLRRRVGDADSDQRAATQAPGGDRRQHRGGAERRARLGGGLAGDARSLPRGHRRT